MSLIGSVVAAMQACPHHTPDNEELLRQYEMRREDIGKTIGILNSHKNHPIRIEYSHMGKIIEYSDILEYADYCHVHLENMPGHFFGRHYEVPWLGMLEGKLCEIMRITGEDGSEIYKSTGLK